MEQPPLSLSEHLLLRDIRDARFARGLSCPRCASTAIIRWGTFSGRQRFRCRGCGRTFSDLTATPLAYTKRLSQWPEYLQHLRDARSLRSSACSLRLHVSTVFRWRHAVLAALRRHEAAGLTGVIEMTELAFVVSRKGCRLPVGSGRRRGYRIGDPFPNRERVVVARSRAGAIVTFGLGGNNVGSWQLEELFRRSIRDPAELLISIGRCGPYVTAARRCELILIRTRLPRRRDDPLAHVENVLRYCRRLMGWLRRFRGVATRYLQNYMAWHRQVDGDCAGAWSETCAANVRPP